jgi:hypothetical protein
VRGRGRWDGRDDQGLKVSAGVYYYRLVSGGHSASQKVVLLKSASSPQR